MMYVLANIFDVYLCDLFLMDGNACSQQVIFIW